MLYNKNPLVVNPELAEKYGLNESIVIQQIHYWCEINKKAGRNLNDGHHWTYNAYEDWQEQFPFWSISTIKRIFQSLEKQGIIVVGNYNKMKIDRTKWYRIEYTTVENSRPSGQIEPMEDSNRSHGTAQIEPTNTQRLPETNPETTPNIYSAPKEVVKKTAITKPSLTTQVKQEFDRHYELIKPGEKFAFNNPTRYGKEIQTIIKNADSDIDKIIQKMGIMVEYYREEVAKLGKAKYWNWTYSNLANRWNEIYIHEEIEATAREWHYKALAMWNKLTGQNLPMIQALADVLDLRFKQTDGDTITHAICAYGASKWNQDEKDWNLMKMLNDIEKVIYYAGRYNTKKMHAKAAAIAESGENQKFPEIKPDNYSELMAFDWMQHGKGELAAWLGVEYAARLESVKDIKVLIDEIHTARVDEYTKTAMVKK